MEKTNKYYSVIENLVKNHKKFQGLDAILDDIIDDVFAHSEVIINSINNESVIQAYLEKVVSTSIITVPKKMGFHSEIKHRVVSTQTPEVKNILQNDIQEEAQLKVENKDVVNNELVDKMINSMPTTFATDDIALDDVVQEVPNSELENDLIIENNEQENLELEFEPNENSEQDAEFDSEQDLETLCENEQVDDVKEDSETNDSQNDLEEALTFDDLENNDTDNLDEEALDITNVEEASDGLAEREDIQDDVDVIDKSIDSVEEFVPIDTEDDLLELSEEDLDMTPQETLELSEPVSEPALEQIAEQPLDILDNSLDDIAESITDTLENGVEEEIKSTEGFKPMDYSIFTFTPQEKDEDVDVDDIKSSLEQLNSKHPELNILKIYELKYKNNDSVAEIATQLNMEEEQVLEALNEMIAVV